MNDKNRHEDLPFKQQLLYFCLKNNQIIKNDNDPIFKLHLSFNKEDIKSILQLDSTEIIQSLYINREKIDKILFDSEEEEVIQIKYDMCKNGLHNLFYLNLILNYNPDVINYAYDKNFIKELYNNNKMEKKNKFKQIIVAKIINDLIKYYKLSNYYDEGRDDEEIGKYKNGSEEIIKNNINIFKALNLNFTTKDILEKKIDLLYKEIIFSLIDLKFKDNTIDIFNQLDLENINLNESITEELWEKLISKDFINYFKIIDINDLFNSEKVQFFYIFFKYIFKSNFYLFKTEIIEFRKKVTEIIFLNQKKKNVFISEKKLKFLDTFTNNNYCNKRQIFFVFKTLLLYFYYKHILNGIIKEDPYLLINNAYIKYTINKKQINESPIDNIEVIILEEEYSDIPKELRIEIPGEYLSLISFLNNFKEKIEQKCNNEYNLMVTLKFNIVGDLEGKAYNINCIYEFEKLDYESDDKDYENRVKRYKDENILVNGLSEGFEFLIDEINDESHNKIINNN